MMPSPWVFALLVLGTYRGLRLIGWDNAPLIERIRNWITGAELVTNGSTNARMGVTNEPVTVTVAYRRPTLEHFLTCPFCVGAWISIAVYTAWVAAGHPGSVGTSSWMWYAMVPLALSGAVGLVSKNLDG